MLSFSTNGHVTAQARQIVVPLLLDNFEYAAILSCCILTAHMWWNFPLPFSELAFSSQPTNGQATPEQANTSQSAKGQLFLHNQ